MEITALSQMEIYVIVEGNNILATFIGKHKYLQLEIGTK